MGRVNRFFHHFQFKGILAIALVFALIAVILFVELSGVRIHYTQRQLTLLDAEQTVTKAQACAALEIDTVLFWNSGEAYSRESKEQFDVMLADMKVGYREVNLGTQDYPSMEDFRVAIVMLSDLSAFGQELTDFFQWVYDGGQAMLPLTLEQNAHSAAIENKIGIQESYGYTFVDHIYVDPDFMLGGGRAYAIPDAYTSARTVRTFSDSTTVYAWEGGPEGVPLIWESDYGAGKFVVDNFGICDKAFRGLYAATLSLLTEAYVYPVINGSTFYLDDFPSQIPGGTNEYIARDYNTTVRDFYLNIWWPDMMNLADKYGLKYTGLAIECYDDAVDGTTDAEPDKQTFLQLGNMLLRKGGELGYHGYNHQPLALHDKDYRDIFDYKTWESTQAMEMAFRHLEDFCAELFPDVEFAVYVPPSNLLTDDGRRMLMEEFPQIRTFSGIYLPDDVLDFALLQEFDVDENGIVDQPRIISGCDIDDFMTLGAFSELNMHLVNDHFTHPDDALDPERGAQLGWAELKNRFESFLKWLYGSVPGIRNCTGTELSAAVQRFAAVTPHRQMREDCLVLTLDHFYDDAQFLVRFNEGKPSSVTGGTLTHLTGELYLLEAAEATVTVKLQ